MKKFNTIIIILMALLSVACEKVIELDIDETEKKVVIEAELKEGTNQFEVIVSQSSFYNESGSSTSIENATVILSDDLGFSVIIPYSGNGIYAETVTATSGRTYSLSVNTNGTTYMASSYMNSATLIEELNTHYVSNAGLSGNSGTKISCKFTDSAGEPNFYRIRYSINNVFQNDPSSLIYFNDDLFDGATVSRGIRGKLFQTGDVVEVELIHLDEPSYDYLYTLGDIIGSSFQSSAAPSNPITNWSEGAMGVFSAYNIDTMSVVIP